MRVRHKNHRAGRILAAGVAFLLTASPAAFGQWTPWRNFQTPCPPPPCAPGETPAPPSTGQPAPPVTTTPMPTPGAPSTPPSTPPLFGPEQSAAAGGETVALAAPGAFGAEGLASNVGYIDSAIPKTMFRLRADAAWDDNRPDRAEFFYPKCGCFRFAQGTPFFDPNAPGPGNVTENKVDFQEFTQYFELAVNNRFSGFLEVPERIIELNDNHAQFGGFGDLNFGFKAAAIAQQDRYLTFQFRTFVPTGDAREGLGTDHVSLEPALLAWQQLSDRLVVEAEFRDWIPIGGTDFAGNVIRYGIGVSYEVYNCRNIRIWPVLELVGWTVLSGKESIPGPIPERDAAGDTIINAKIGVRAAWGEHSDAYIGYGRPITDDVWYMNIFRLEYRYLF